MQTRDHSTPPSERQPPVHNPGRPPRNNHCPDSYWHDLRRMASHDWAATRRVCAVHGVPAPGDDTAA